MTHSTQDRTPMTPAELFFFRFAGYSYNPKTETEKQGHIRCAKSLAEAERLARNLGWDIQWSDDWSIGSHKDFFGDDSAYFDREPSTCENAVLIADDGTVLASLGCIDDADTNYRRVIKAELALEALADYDKEIEVLDAH